MSRTFFSDLEKNGVVKENLEKNLAKYGEMYYGYGVMNKRNMDDMLIITNLPGIFIDDYKEKKYQSIDPIIVNALNRVSPLIWDNSLKVNDLWIVDKIFESVKSYNIISGQTFVLHDQNNNLVVLSLYINKFLMAELDAEVKRHKNDLQGLLIDTHELLLHLYRDENKPQQNTESTLSSRENSILYWSSTGKTYPEIARILNITVSTVKFHMGNIVRKLGVKNAKHAISLAIELNIISHPSDK
ncbi:MAG: LuxR family transcriptional regulator [Pantoea sp.]|uniref:helix-turn-helix transcriptional regulator n=1 Tax=unclassified Pantoea TaxID=2630326 RepID=UPI002396C2D7|nr:LuxR family transcriptional regulator [Pantoea sp.]MDE1186425.1 LuxR family transcriptional regulator [Pantoea sp.]